MAPTRIAYEDALLALVRAAAPAGVPVDVLPLREEDQRAKAMAGAAIWLAYLGGRYVDPTADYVQAGSWQWAIAVHARDYRSPRARGEAALELLDQVEAGVVGKLITDRRVVRVADSLLPPLAPGVVGYELVVAIDTMFRRVNGG